MTRQLALDWMSEAYGSRAAVGDSARALARRTDSETSKRAAQRALVFKGSHESKIYAWIADHPQGQTYREIAAGTNLEPVAVGRRIKSLRETAGVYADGERGGMQIWQVRA